MVIARMLDTSCSRTMLFHADVCTGPFAIATYADGPHTLCKGALDRWLDLADGGTGIVCPEPLALEFL